VGIQTILGVILGLAALFYVIKTFISQLHKPHVDPKCENCDVPSIIEDLRRKN